MSLPEVHQFLPSLGYRDATGNHTRAMRSALAARGYKGAIWAEHIHDELYREAKNYRSYDQVRSSRSGENLLLYQASTGSTGMADYLLARPERKLMYFHNITPSSFFGPYDPIAASVLKHGRFELRDLAAATPVAMANSWYSARELGELGVEEVVVVPPYLPPDVNAALDPEHAAWLRTTKRGIDVLFVGRIVPNKGHLHLLRTFAALREGTDAKARLFCVGFPGPPSYMDAIRKLRDKLGNDGVVFTGPPSDSTLASHFAEADVFVCLSEHEGFGLPLISAMRADVPVVAYDAAAVGETLGGAGVLVRTLDPLVVAEVVVRVASDESLRKELIAGQRRRLAELEAIPRDDLIVRCVQAARAR